MAKEQMTGRFTGRPTQQQGSEWVEAAFRLDSGREITVSTKFPEKARLMAGLSDVPAVIEVDHTTSQNNGFTRHRFYFGRVISSGYEQPQDTGIDIVPAPAANAAPAGGRDFEPHNLRAWRIALGAGAHLAVETMPLMPNEQRSFDTQKQIALAWALWIFTNGRETPTLHNDPAPPPVPPSGDYSEPWADPGAEAPRGYQDEDIPF